ncbi:MAG: AzlD domain-containing protein [Christensenellaceae bacterium]
MNEWQMALYVLAMAGVTYLIRMLPMSFLRKKIKSEYIRSLFYYLPYAVLSAMTFPAVFYSTGNVVTAIIAVVVAVVLSLFKQSLIVVSIVACVSALLLGFIF